ncbi:MAG: NAD(P)H-dependent oxidoreductase [Firmicutes bacterium]|nr:NAD(P)H-dependent oxidoreductase [Bacillota bacterium]
MKILVLNGSPKGSESVTMQSVKIMDLYSKKNAFQYYDVIKHVDKLDKIEEQEHLKELIKESDGIIWAFPVYHLLVPGHYKRFIEKIYDSSVKECLNGKHSVVFTTSINYYDVVAHKYMKEVLCDLGSLVVDSLSHDMESIFNVSARKELVQCIENLNFALENGISFSNKKIVKKDLSIYKGVKGIEKIHMKGRICIVGDISNSKSLSNMVEEYTSYFDNTDIIDLSNIDNYNYCIGCLRCSRTQKCIHENSDDLRRIIDRIKNNYDIIVFAGEIKDRYLTWRMKTFFDRTFVYNHIPVFKGKQVAYIISGELSKNDNLKNILEIYSQGGRNLIGIVSDELEDMEEISRNIKTLAQLTKRYFDDNYFRSETFYGVSGHKIFRDAVYGNLGTIFKYDYQYYKQNKQFDYIKTIDKIKYCFRRIFFNRKKVEKFMNNNMTSLMVSGHKKVVEEVSKNVEKY